MEIKHHTTIETFLQVGR